MCLCRPIRIRKKNNDDDDIIDQWQEVVHTFPIPRPIHFHGEDPFSIEGKDIPMTRAFNPEPINNDNDGHSRDNSGDGIVSADAVIGNVGGFFVPLPPEDDQDVLSVEGETATQTD